MAVVVRKVPILIKNRQFNLSKDCAFDFNPYIEIDFMGSPVGIAKIYTSDTGLMADLAFYEELLNGHNWRHITATPSYEGDNPDRQNMCNKANLKGVSLNILPVAHIYTKQLGVLNDHDAEEVESIIL